MSCNVSVALGGREELLVLRYGRPSPSKGRLAGRGTLDTRWGAVLTD